MIKSVKVALLVLFILISRFPLHAADVNYEIYVNEIVSEIASQAYQEFGLHCIGDGGRMPRDVEAIEVDFIMHRRATVDEARLFEIRLAERLLALINSHEKLRPYLREYPFTHSRVSVNIGFAKENNDHICDGFVTHMFMVKGKIFYHGYDPIQGQPTDLYKESYEEARAIVENNHTGNLLVHQPLPYEDHVDKLFRDFAREVKKKYGLNCYREGGKLARGIEELAFHFTTSKRTSLEKARQLEVQITERLLEIVNNDETIRPYLKAYPFTPDRAKVGITIQKKPYDYHTDGSVAKVVPQEGKIVYLAMRPSTETRTPIKPDKVLCEESFEEAKLKSSGKGRASERARPR